MAAMIRFCLRWQRQQWKSGGLLLTVTGMDAGDKVNGANKTDAGVSAAFDIIRMQAAARH